jgi:branched-subunit amino acid aminotransferase/4-amino-4-deoxychorismate lyase
MLAADEVFVCSTSRFVVCATEIDGIVKKCEVGLKIRKLLEE